MTIRHLNIFIAVYQSGSITRASEQLYMTQPAVTRAIKELEQYYGITLFERINQRLSVTEAGKQFYSYALHITDSFDRMEKSMRNWDELGLIRVGASPTLGSIILPRLLKEFKRQHPSISVKLTVSNASLLLEALEHNELDFALIEGELSHEKLCFEEFGEDRLVLLLPPESELLEKETLTLEDLRGYPLLLREKGSMIRRHIDRIFSLHGMPIEPAMESISTHALVQAVHEGLGISFLPERLVEHSIESGFLASRPVQDEFFRRKNYIVWHRNKLLSASTKDFFTLCHSMSD